MSNPTGLIKTAGFADYQRESLVRWALNQNGKPYHTFRDCSGFTAAAYRQVGITIPEGSVAQFGVGEWDPYERRWQLGDLLFWDTFGPAPGHVALYVGDGKVVHALNEERGIVISEVQAPMGGPYMGARRIFAPTDSTIVEEPAPVEESPRPKARWRTKQPPRTERRKRLGKGRA